MQVLNSEFCDEKVREKIEEGRKGNVAKNDEQFQSQNLPVGGKY